MANCKCCNLPNGVCPRCGEEHFPADVEHWADYDKITGKAFSGESIICKGCTSFSPQPWDLNVELVPTKALIERLIGASIEQSKEHGAMIGYTKEVTCLRDELRKRMGVLYVLAEASS